MMAMTDGKNQNGKQELAVDDGKKKLEADTQKKKQMYLLWRSMPALLRTLEQKDLVKMGYETTDPVFQTMLGIKSQNAFCEHFGVSNNQPSRWLQDEVFVAEIEKATRNDHVMKFAKEIDFSFVQSTIRNPEAAKVKLFHQIYRGWSEKIEHLNTNRNIDLLELVKEIEKRNTEIRAKKPREKAVYTLSPTGQ